MDIQKYIESGILEEYCLGLLTEEEQAYFIQMTMLYPEIKEELTTVEITFEKLAGANAISPDSQVKQRILASLDFDTGDKKSNLNRFPQINKNSKNSDLWDMVNHLVPETSAMAIKIELIRADEHFQQMLVIAKADIPEEEHGEYLESFYILKGLCECKIGDVNHKLGEGDFIEIPLHVKHNVKLLSPLVIAILQYQFI